jgi:hypothetical protein
MVMIEKDKRELLWTEKRITYNNTWPEAGQWYSDVQQMLDEWLHGQGITQIFEPVKLSEGAKDILFPNAKLNKVFSGILISMTNYLTDQMKDSISHGVRWRYL